LEVSTDFDAQEAVGQVAGLIWRTLDTTGEITLVALRKQTESTLPQFDWAIGWLAREGKIILTPDKRSYLIRLSHQQPKPVKVPKAVKTKAASA
jgi:hypothetical protein